MTIPPQRLLALNLEIQLYQAQEQHDLILMTLIRQRQRERERRIRRWWVKPWIMRRRLFGQYYTLFLELERESRGDYIGYIRMNPNMFAELLLRVAPRITKGPRCVFFLFSVSRKNTFLYSLLDSYIAYMHYCSR